MLCGEMFKGVVAHVDRVREEAITRIMHTFDMDREDAERFVDRSEGGLFDLDDTFSLGDGFDVGISEQVTQMILIGTLRIRGCYRRAQ